MRTPILALLFLFAGCGPKDETAANPDTHQSLAAETLQVMDAYVAVLEQVIDGATAEAHKAEIEDYRAQLQGLKRRSEALGEMTPEQAAALTEEYGERLRALYQRQGQIGMRFERDPAIRAVLTQSSAAAPQPD